MWLGVAPSELCDQHLLGEHRECHTIAGYLAAGRNPSHWTRNGWIVIGQLDSRHEALAQEMRRRGFRHNDGLPLPAFQFDGPDGAGDPIKDRTDLAARPHKCRGKCVCTCLGT